MKQRSRQLLFALLSLLMLGQSVAAVAGHCEQFCPPQTSETTETICQSGCCEAPAADAQDCCETSGCNGYCHTNCQCHDLTVTLGITPPVLDVPLPVIYSSPYRFVHYDYTDPEPQSLLRPPCL